MIKAMVSLGALVFGVWSQSAFGHGEAETRIVLEPELTSFSAGMSTYKFKLIDTETNKLVSDSDLSIAHEKKLHLVIYDSSLNEFQHIHPEFNGNSWSVSAQFLVNGEYWVWAQGELAADGTEFSTSSKLSVSGGVIAWPTPPALSDMRSGQSGVSKINLSSNKVTAGKMAMLDLIMTRTDGSNPQLSPYMGAFAHVIATPDDGDSLIHVHPVSTGQSKGMLHAAFPSAGLYRLWIQFIDDGNLKVIPVSIKVF